jgi:hypothetical protein
MNEQRKAIKSATPTLHHDKDTLLVPDIGIRFAILCVILSRSPGVGNITGQK